MDADTLLSNLQSQANTTQQSAINVVNLLLGQINGVISAERTIADKTYVAPGRTLSEVSGITITAEVDSPDGDAGGWPTPIAGAELPEIEDSFLGRAPTAWANIYPDTIVEPSVSPTWPTIDAIKPAFRPDPTLTVAEVDGDIDFSTYLTTDVALVESAVRNWVTAYTPEYAESLALLERYSMEGIETGTGLPTLVETAMVNRKRKSIDRERLAAERMALRVETARGGDVLQPTYLASLRSINAQYSDQIAMQNEEVYLWRAKTEVKHRQFCMQTATQLHATVTQAMVNWGQIFVQYKNALTNYWAAIAKIQADAHNAKMNADVTVYTSKLDQDAKLYGLDLEADKVDMTGYQVLTGYQGELLRSRTDLIKNETAADISEVQATTTTYTAELDARIKLESLKADTVLKKYASDIELSGLDIEGYKAYANWLIGKFNGQVESDKNRVQALAAQFNAQVEARKILAVQYEGEVKGSIADYEGRIRNNQLEAELLLKANTAAMQAYASASGALADIAAAAIHVMNGMAINQVTTTKKGT